MRLRSDAKRSADSRSSVDGRTQMKLRRVSLKQMRVQKQTKVKE